MYKKKTRSHDLEGKKILANPQQVASIETCGTCSSLSHGAQDVDPTDLEKCLPKNPGKWNICSNSRVILGDEDLFPKLLSEWKWINPNSNVYPMSFPWNTSTWHHYNSPSFYPCRSLKHKFKSTKGIPLKFTTSGLVFFCMPHVWLHFPSASSPTSFTCFFGKIRLTPLVRTAWQRQLLKRKNHLAFGRHHEGNNSFIHLAATLYLRFVTSPKKVPHAKRTDQENDHFILVHLLFGKSWHLSLNLESHMSKLIRLYFK